MKLTRVYQLMLTSYLGTLLVLLAYTFRSPPQTFDSATVLYATGTLYWAIYSGFAKEISQGGIVVGVCHHAVFCLRDYGVVHPRHRALGLAPDRADTHRICHYHAVHTLAKSSVAFTS